MIKAKEPNHHEKKLKNIKVLKKYKLLILNEWLLIMGKTTKEIDLQKMLKNTKLI